MQYRNRNQEEIIASNVGNDSSVTGDTVKDALETLDAAITAEDIWDRTGTTIEPKNAGDDVNIGTGTYIGSAIAPSSDGETGLIFTDTSGFNIACFDTLGYQFKLLQDNDSDATSYATQRDSNILNFETSMWNGASEEKGNWTIQSRPSTTSNIAIFKFEYGGVSIFEIQSNAYLNINTYASILKQGNSGITTPTTESIQYRIQNTNTTVDNYTGMVNRNANNMYTGFCGFKNTSHNATTGSAEYELWLAKGAAATKSNALLTRSLIDSNLGEPAGSYYDLDSGRSGWGFVQIGDNQEYAWFAFTTAGVVSLIENSANVVKVAPFDGNLVIRDNGTNVRIVNELGATLLMTLSVFYN